jgi:D-aminopeptidase
MQTFRWAAAILLVTGIHLHAQIKSDAVPERARDLGVPFDGVPGPLNSITDVAGVEVGHTTLVSGNYSAGAKEPVVRTGVTVVLPRGKANNDPVYAGWFSQNGNGEMTGTTWIEESGFLEGPVGLTNTHSVGRWWPKPGMGGSMTSTAFTSNLKTCSMLSIRPGPGR